MREFSFQVTVLKRFSIFHDFQFFFFVILIVENFNFPNRTVVLGVVFY